MHFTTLEGPLNCLSVNKDCSQVVVAGRNVFKIFNINENQFEERLNLRVGKYINLNFSASDIVWNQNDEHILASSATNGAVVTWNINKATRSKQDHVYHDHKMCVNRVCFHHNEPHLLMSGSKDGFMKLFDLRSHSVCASFNNNSQSVRDVQFSKHNDAWFAAACENGNIQLWDYRNPSRYETQFPGHTDPVFSLDWHQEEKLWLATCSRDKMIKVWDMSVPQRPQMLYCVNTIASVARIKWRPQRMYHIASCAFVIDCNINVWDVRRPYIPFATFTQHKDVVTGLAWKKSDPHVILSSSKDSKLIYHMFKDAKRPVENANPVGVCINLNGQVLHAYSERVDAKGSFNSTKLPSFFRHVPDKSETFTLASSSLVEYSTEAKCLDMDWIVYSAEHYMLTGRPLGELCEHNAQVAKRLGRQHVMETWQMIKLLYSTDLSSPNLLTKTQHNRTDTHKDGDGNRSKNLSAVESAHKLNSKFKDAIDEYSTGMSEEESDLLEGVEGMVMDGMGVGYGMGVGVGVGGATAKKPPSHIDALAHINGGHNFFDDEDNIDHTHLDYDTHYEYNRQDEWSLPNEAFFPRCELEDYSEAQDPHHHHPHLTHDSPSSDTDMAATSQRTHNDGSKITSSAEANIKEEFFEMSPFVSMVPDWSFNKLIVQALKYHAHMGDVQTSVSALIVLGDKIRTLIDDMTLQQWYTAYIDLLGRFKLWTIATEIINLSKVQVISVMNHNSTTIYTRCATCNKELTRPHGWICKNCKQIKACVICHQPVKGLYAWCQGCSHGGHLAHLKTWFKTHQQCPAGCGHRCEYE